MSRRGNCWDNAPQESFFGHFKDEAHIKTCTSVTAKVNFTLSAKFPFTL